MEKQKEIKLYNFDPETKEYTGFSEAEADPEETLLQGKFIPLVPAHSTLIVPPECGENEIPVFEDDNWAVKKDYRKTHYTVDNDFNVKEIKEIGGVSGYLVTKETGEDIKQNPSHYKISDNEIVKKTEEEISSEKIRKEKERKSMLSLTAADVERALYKTKGIDFEDIIRLVEEINDKIDAAQSVFDMALKNETKAKETFEQKQAEPAEQEAAGNKEKLKNALKNAQTSISIQDAKKKYEQARQQTQQAKKARELLPENKTDIKALKIELKANNFYRGNPYVEQIGTLLGYSTEDIDYLFMNKQLPVEPINETYKNFMLGF